MRSVAPKSWEGISSSATRAALSTRPITPAVTATARNASPWPRPSGFQKQTSELLPVGYPSGLHPTARAEPLILGHKRILLALLFKAVSETLLEFGQRRLAQRSGLSPCFIPGIKPSKITFISIVWSLPALCPSITAVGLQNGQTFCFPSQL